VTLRDFEISKKQVLAVGTDSASNMNLAVKTLSEDSVVDENEAESEQEGTATLVETIASAFADYSQEFSTMSHMRCAAHTLQLASRDGLKINAVASLISRIRHVVVAARTPKIDAILKRKVYKGAILDQATRWGSTYLMIERLLELKDTLVDIAHPDVSLPEVQWNEIKGLESILRHPFLFTKKLQAADLTPGTFYMEWKKLLFKFTQIGGSLDHAMKASMEKGETVLLENVLLAAVSVDPMYRITLTEEQQERGRKALLSIAHDMK